MGKPAKNDITRAKLITKPSSEQYRNGWERIFKQRKQEHAEALAEHQPGVFGWCDNCGAKRRHCTCKENPLNATRSDDV